MKDNETKLNTFFCGFTSLWKSKRAMKDFLNEDILVLEKRHAILHYYRPKIGKNKKSVNWRDLADRVFSEYIRLKESDENGYGKCITCQKMYFWEDGQCGHYRTRACMKFRFDESNAHFQCYNCNCNLNGNYRNYKIQMDFIYGAFMEEYLRTNNELVKYSQTRYMQNIEKRYDEICLFKTRIGEKTKKE